MSEYYNMTEQTGYEGDPRVIDRDPTLEDVNDNVTDFKPHGCNGRRVNLDFAMAVNPTPCGYYDGDPERWEISEIIVDDTDTRCPVQVGMAYTIYKTLNEAITVALQNVDKVFVMRTAV